MHEYSGRKRWENREPGGDLGEGEFDVNDNRERDRLTLHTHD